MDKNVSEQTPKEPLLFLCHRIPFPPNKGDKIRSFNMLKKLSEKFDIHLGCFIDDPFDKQYAGKLNEYCQSVFTLNQSKILSKINGLKSFVSGQPISLPYYFDSKMQQWVNRIVAHHDIKQAFVYSSSMAQYIENNASTPHHKMDRIIDFVDVDSDKWRQYAAKKSGIAKWVFNREYRLLAQYENLICDQFDRCIFVSPDEAKLFRDYQPEHNQRKVSGLLNGVDIDFFDPSVEFSKETLVPTIPFISFTGAMDYWANIDSVMWFVENVWPTIIKKKPQTIFCIVGGNPSAEVIALGKQQGIVVTGRVHDVRPFIANAKCVVAPIQIARGIQNKVLEAMSLNKNIVCTPMAMEGINAIPSGDIKITDGAQQFAIECVDYLTTGDSNCKNRHWIIENFTWQQTLAPLMQYFRVGANSENYRN